MYLVLWLLEWVFSWITELSFISKILFKRWVTLTWRFNGNREFVLKQFTLNQVWNLFIQPILDQQPKLLSPQWNSEKYWVIWTLIFYLKYLTPELHQEGNKIWISHSNNIKVQLLILFYDSSFSVQLPSCECSLTNRNALRSSGEEISLNNV